MAMLGLNDPNAARREMVSRLLAEQAQGPTGGPWGAAAQGLNKIAQALIAQKMIDEDRTRQAGANATLENAMRLGSDQAPETVTYPGQNGEEGTTINWDARKGDPKAMVRALMGNPDTSAYGIQLFGQQQQRDQENQDWANRFKMQDAALAARAREAERAADERQQILLKGQRDLAGINNAAEMDRARLTASLRPERNVQTVTTADGVFVLNSDGTRGNKIGDAPKSQAGLSPTAQKELFSADDVINQATGAEDALTSALGLVGHTYNGAGADTKTWLARNAPEILGGNPDKAADSTKFKSLITEQALQGMKAIFGANPTEGERAILLEMQAAPNMSPQEQTSLLNRAVQAVQARKKFASERAAQLREGTYFKGDGPSAIAPSAMPGPRTDASPPSSGWSIQRVP